MVVFDSKKTTDKSILTGFYQDFLHWDPIIGFNGSASGENGSFPAIFSSKFEVDVNLVLQKILAQNICNSMKF